MVGLGVQFKRQWREYIVKVVAGKPGMHDIHQFLRRLAEVFIQCITLGGQMSAGIRPAGLTNVNGSRWYS